ncbi:hypothetical protein [Streptomyces sp. CNQ085]|uniref:hypothetical protein n=1 Tax=Streptomyces sp. CNQ085 TaxID=2886944 RepID=UPI0027E41F14|nr:hypothetical protein [Streptomyces sp. CNQ085]
MLLRPVRDREDDAQAVRFVADAALLVPPPRRPAARPRAAALGAVGESRQVRIEGLTAGQQWALDVGLAAGLEPDTAGWVALRGMRPPSPYVPCAAFP